MSNSFIIPTVICDIDGCLANVDHRVRFVQSEPKNWPAWDRRMAKDTPNLDIIWIIKSLHAAGATILIASGRGEENRNVTIDWLDNVAQLKGIYKKLYMRPKKDTRPDNVIKSEILDQMIEHGYNPTIVFDDRNQVVNMWRERGLRCLQVNYGDF